MFYNAAIRRFPMFYDADDSITFVENGVFKTLRRGTIAKCGGKGGKPGPCPEGGGETHTVKFPSPQEMLAHQENQKNNLRNAGLNRQVNEMHAALKGGAKAEKSSNEIQEGHDKGHWVYNPQTKLRGLVSHVYHDIPPNEHGLLMQVDFGGSKRMNYREGKVLRSQDQTSKWADKSKEG